MASEDQEEENDLLSDSETTALVKPQEVRRTSKDVSLQKEEDETEEVVSKTFRSGSVKAVPYKKRRLNKSISLGSSRLRALLASNLRSSRREKSFVVQETLIPDEADQTDKGLEGIQSTSSSSSEFSEEEYAPQILSLLEPQLLPENPYNDAYSEGLRNEDFQVSVTIIEGRLSGPSVDPVVCIQVLNSGKLLRKAHPIGRFALDVATVYAQPNHQFYHKWAMLVDPENPEAGEKGYLKCDIAVYGKGDNVSASTRLDRQNSHDNNIEGNLLLPIGASQVRLQADYIMSIYHAEHLPINAATGVSNAVKNALSNWTDSSDNYTKADDVFVQVSFGGHVGKTSTRKLRNQKIFWNEELKFVQMFPPLFRRIRIEIFRKNYLGTTTLIATNFLDLATISDKGPKGFLPTFGPTSVHFYGSLTDDGSMFDKSAVLNEGVGEGIAYRGSLYISFKAVINENRARELPGAYVKPILFPTNNSDDNQKSFLLFGAILAVNMLDRKLYGKQVHLEISMGNHGVVDNTLTSKKNGMTKEMKLSQWNLLFGRDSASTSVTPALSADICPQKNSSYCYICFGDSKPCVFLIGKWSDLRWRHYYSNYLRKFIETFERELNAVETVAKSDKAAAKDKFNSAIDQFNLNSCKYLSYVQSRSTSWVGMNNLDKERCAMHKKIMEKMSDSLRKQKCKKGKCSTKRSFCKRIEYTKKSLEQIKELLIEPQDGLPDIFLWLVQENKRVAYHRIPACNLLYSAQPEERGQDCAKIRSYYLKLPSGKTSVDSIWRIHGQVTAALWLGLNSDRKGIIDGVSKGYKMTSEVKSIEKPKSPLPNCLEYTDTFTYSLRCHLYQGRSLLAADSNGLSDPFARILYMGYSAISHAVEKTRNPFWDETLEIQNVTFSACPRDFAFHPPNIVVELFDQNIIGSADFIGQALLQPVVKTLEDMYIKPRFPPTLQWFPVYRGTEHGGDILAAFELIQQNSDGTLPGDVPDLNAIRQTASVPLISVPQYIRPALTKYRLEVLFWGLRDLQKINFLPVTSPKIEIRCCGQQKSIASETILDYKKTPNFPKMHVSMNVRLPQNVSFWPPIEIRCIDCCSFGREHFVGSHTIENIQQLLHEEKPDDDGSLPRLESFITDTDAEWTNNDIRGDNEETDQQNSSKLQLIKNRKKPNGHEHLLIPDSEQLDWWSKYFASIHRQAFEEKLGSGEKRGIMKYLERTTRRLSGISTTPNETPSIMNRALVQRKQIQSMQKQQRCVQFLDEHAHLAAIKIYNQELESVPEFHGFHDWIDTFPLYRGKDSVQSTDKEREIGKFKGKIGIASLPLEGRLKNGLFQRGLKNETVQVDVRVYIIKAINLCPTGDYNGKADPYLYLTLGKAKINDKQNYISKQLNPTFGKTFEFQALFPQESHLLVQVYDWDLMSTDDLIGETRIDLEDRFYTRHRATCGLAEKYAESGYNAWRDPFKPSQILEKHCKHYRLKHPVYMEGKVKIGTKTFKPPGSKETSYNLAGV